MVSYIRTKMEVDELVDLWNLLFSANRVIYYNEVDEAVEYSEENPVYAE